jgi:Ser/Thr protein kinase RdoA (MazF antagonist)
MSIPWHQAAWRDGALAWIDGELERLGIERQGEVEQPHAFWWSTAMRVPTASGDLWFKAVQPEGAFEARLTPLLAQRWPDRTVELLATDGERGWMLARDAGTKLRELNDGRAVEHWEALLPRYAEMQVGLASRVGELERIGVPSLRLAELPGELAAALDEPEFLRSNEDGGVDQTQREQLVRELPSFADACARLAAMGVPETIQHDDLNDGNAFLRGDDHVVFDWGDACISHPFHSLVVVLRSLAYRHRWKPGGPQVNRLLDAYLEAWAGFGSRQDLTAAADVARQTGTIQRSLAWRRYAQVMPSDVRSVYVESVPYGLRLYLMDGPWGTWDDGSF